MGKKKSGTGGTGLGRALIKERLQAGRGYRRNDTWLHTTELNDGYDWGRLNLQSVTEQSSMDDFLATAEMAGTEFVAEKLNIKFVPVEARTGLLTVEETSRIKKLHEENKQLLRIPRRPHWDENTSSEVLQQSERDSFLLWRRELAQLEEEQKFILTPFERNLDFWRQLWRVIERSDVVVQILDARNPSLFRCLDLETYVKEVSEHKVNMLLLNKADLLTREQRRVWARYFQKEGIRAVFWSALAEAQRLDAEEKVSGLKKMLNISMGLTGQQELQGEQLEEDEDKTASEDEEEMQTPEKEETQTAEKKEEEKPESRSGQKRKETEEEDDDEEEASESEDQGDLPSGDSAEEEVWNTCSEEEDADDEDDDEEDEEKDKLERKRVQKELKFRNSSRLLRKDELLAMFKSAHSGAACKEGQITVGLVGYPNVGKSSTINTIFRNKKVSVSATPGHTKHFQTLFVEADLCLCDCPGLVMPSFVSTKAEMICSGILPIDQMRDHVPAISLTIPRAVLEGTYGINIIRPREDEDPDRSPTSEEFLSAYGYMRGFMTTHGMPDQPRSSRYVLKDYVSGKLLYCHPPAHINPKDFQPQHARFQEKPLDQTAGNTSNKKSKVKRIENTVDKQFFHQENVRALTRGVQMVMGYKPGSGPQGQGNADTAQPAGKPWKKHGNRNKKEKIRRLTKHLDA